MLNLLAGLDQSGKGDQRSVFSVSVLCDCTSGLIRRLCGSCSKAAHLAEVAPANHLQDVEVFSLKTSLLHLLYQRFSCD